MNLQKEQDALRTCYVHFFQNIQDKNAKLEEENEKLKLENSKLKELIKEGKKIYFCANCKRYMNYGATITHNVCGISRESCCDCYFICPHCKDNEK